MQKKDFIIHVIGCILSIIALIVACVAFCQAQPPGLKPQKSKDFKIVTDTLYARWDTTQVKYILSVGEDGKKYLAPTLGYIITKTYLGKYVKEDPISTYHFLNWEAIKPEEIESVREFKFKPQK